MRLKISILLFISLLGVSISFAQDKSNRGKEFWLAYGFDYSFFHETPVNNQELALYISTELAATVIVSITNTGYTQTLNIPANTVDATILIPKSGPDDARTLTDGLQPRNIHIVSDVPVAVYAHVYSTQVSGATMLMPVETYGYSYYSINYYQTTSQSNPADWYSWFYAIASEDNTRLEITPSDTTKNGWLPGQTYTVNLNKGESFHVFGKAVFLTDPALASKDMTGSKIVSVPGADGNCHPVAVFSGSGGIRLCRGDGGEFMHQQVFPAQAWGTRYLTYHTINNVNTDINETNRNYYRVCVSDPTAVVRRNGLVLTGLIKNFFYEFMDSTGGDYIESDKPILVSQYTPNKNQCWNYPTTNPAPPSYGDPEMFYLSPIEQGQKSVLFYASRKSAIDYVYVNIHFPTAAIGSLRVDGTVVPAAQIIPHPNYPSYSVAVRRFVGPAAQHTITCDSAFTATVYGLGNFESYGYNVGTLINNLNYYSEIKNVNNTSGNTDTFTCPKTPVRLFVKVGYPATSIHWKLSQVTGITPNTDSIITNPVPIATEQINGRTYYTYTLQQDFSFLNAGTYYIPVSYSAAVIQNCSQTENASVKVVVKPGPVANFIFPSPSCLTDSVHFTGTSIPGSFNIVSYSWLFDDNTTANTVNTVKLFTTAGNQNVRYRIYADNGCVGDTTKTITLAESPVVNLGNDISTCGSGPIVLDVTNTNSTYLWQDGSTNPTFSVTTSGLYWVQVTKAAGGCSKRDSINITLGSFPGFNLGADRAICQGDTVTLNATVAGAISYLWNTGAITPAINVFAAGTYWCEVNNGCVQRDSIVITAVNPLPVVNLGNDILVCGNNPITLNATNPNSTYLWQDGSTNPTYSATASGLYWVRVTNSSGCIKRDSINIAFNSIPVFNLGTDAAICQGDSLTLNATVASAISYLWSTGATSPTIKAWQAGTYWCEVNNGCIFRDSLTITAVNPVPVVNLGNDISVCGNNPITLNATNPNSTYLWQDGSTNSTYNATASGLFWVQVTSNAGCSKRDSINIAFNSIPVFNLGADASICQGDSLTLNATVVSATSYLWNTGATTPTIKAWQAGTYWCEVNNGCVFRDSITITAVNPKPVVNLGNDIAVCGNNPITLNAINPNSTYLWQDGSTNSTYNATASGLYWVQVTNSNGCSKRDSINIAFNPLPVFNLGPDTDLCQGDTLTLNATVTGATSYLWNTSAVTSSIKGYQPGIYWCEVTKQGCLFRDSLVITAIKPSPIVNIGNDVTVCEGVTVTLDATYLSSAYLWQDGSTNPVFSAAQPGLYYVQVDLNGCKRSDTIRINHNLKPRFTLGPDQAICPGNTITLNPVLNTAWQLAWQDGTSGPTYTVTQPGSYSLSAINNCGSTTDDMLVSSGICKVFVPNAFTPNSDGKNDQFKILGTEDVTQFNLKIFNRWGEIVFETNEKSKGWDGNLGGRASPIGVFIYTLNYKDKNSTESKTLKGTLTLIR